MDPRVIHRTNSGSRIIILAILNLIQTPMTFMPIIDHHFFPLCIPRDLSSNHFSGPLPTALAKLRNLTSEYKTVKISIKREREETLAAAANGLPDVNEIVRDSGGFS
ncbi:hypothetical protein HanRHA438_Chr01g0000661 [Helianthus annuus]|nr:hypothetical protein HanRHA438_Chr01g0000661 [Helianthus annuus]